MSEKDAIQKRIAEIDKLEAEVGGRTFLAETFIAERDTLRWVLASGEYISKNELRNKIEEMINERSEYDELIGGKAVTHHPRKWDTRTLNAVRSLLSESQEEGVKA